MNTSRSEMSADKPYFIATMFNAAIVWDASRLAIAANMTDTERRAIAKRATGILRDNMPEITGALGAYETARTRFAQTTVMRQIGNAGFLKPIEIDRNEKKYQRSEKVLQNIDSITTKYRAQSGYRVACLSLLLPDCDRRSDVLVALNDLQLLYGVQQTFFQALLLKDLLHWSSQYSLSYPEYDIETATATQLKKLNSRVNTLSTTMEGMQTQLLGTSVKHHLDNERLKNPVLNGTDQRNPEITGKTQFTMVQNCFKNLNELLSLQITNSMDNSIQGAADWNLSLLKDV